SSRRRHTRFSRDWSSDVCSSDLEELVDGARLDQVVGFEIAVDVLGQLVVLGRIGAVPVVKGNMETVEVLLAPGGDIGHELLRRQDRKSVVQGKEGGRGGEQMLGA